MKFSIAKSTLGASMILALGTVGAAPPTEPFAHVVVTQEPSISSERDTIAELPNEGVRFYIRTLGSGVALKITNGSPRLYNLPASSPASTGGGQLDTFTSRLTATCESGHRIEQRLPARTLNIGETFRTFLYCPDVFADHRPNNVVPYSAKLSQAIVLQGGNPVDQPFANTREIKLFNYYSLAGKALSMAGGAGLKMSLTVNNTFAVVKLINDSDRTVVVGRNFDKQDQDGSPVDAYLVCKQTGTGGGVTTVDLNPIFVSYEPIPAHTTRTALGRCPSGSTPFYVGLGAEWNPN